MPEVWEVTCGRCGYTWSTRSEMKQVTCPSCGYKTPKGAGEGEKTGIQVSGEVHRKLMKRKELSELIHKKIE